MVSPLSECFYTSSIKTPLWECNTFGLSGRFRALAVKNICDFALYSFRFTVQINKKRLRRREPFLRCSLTLFLFLRNQAAHHTAGIFFSNK